jgi:hypothetical protein
MKETALIYLIAGLSVAALPSIVILGMLFGYDSVELTFHPPVSVKIKLSRRQHRH